MRNLGHCAAILLAFPIIIGGISWGVGQLLPADIKALPSQVREVQRDMAEVKQALGIRTSEDVRYNTKKVAAATGSPRNQGNPPAKEMEAVQ